MARFKPGRAACAAAVAVWLSAGGAARGGTTAAVDALSPASLHPLLLGFPADPASPLAQALRRHAAGLAELAAPGAASLAPAAAAAYLSQAAPAGPAEAAAAAVLARVLSQPQARSSFFAAYPAPAGEPLGRLPAVLNGKEQAAGLAALGQLATASLGGVEDIFEGRRPSLGLESLTLKGGALRDASGKKVPRLGHGQFGVVHPHPAIDGAVIKIVEHDFEVMLMTAVTPAETSAEEEETSRALAAAGAGPRYLGRTIKDGRHLSVRERIIGKTVAQLIHERAYGAPEHALMLEMLKRMALAGLKTDDMRLPNIMIGVTKADPVRRAYVVDGGKIQAVDGSLGAERLAEDLYRQPLLIAVRFDQFAGPIESRRPLNVLLEEGLARSNDKTAVQKLKRFLKNLLSTPVPAPWR